MLWLKRLLLAIANLAVIYILLNEIITAPFYSEEEIQRAREGAVELARSGALEAAITAFEAILTIAPDHRQTKQDYLVVLHWDNQDSKVITQFDTSLAQDAPQYFIEAIMEAALATEANELAATLFKNEYLFDINYKIKDSIRDTWMDRLVIQAREGLSEEAISELMVLKESNPDDARLHWELVLLQTWADQTKEAVATYEQFLMSVSTMPGDGFTDTSSTHSSPGSIDPTNTSSFTWSPTNTSPTNTSPTNTSPVIIGSGIAVPHYVKEALAYSYNVLGQQTKAENLYLELSREAEPKSEWLAGLANSYVNSGKYQELLELSNRQLKRVQEEDGTIDQWMRLKITALANNDETLQALRTEEQRVSNIEQSYATFKQWHMLALQHSHRHSVIPIRKDFERVLEKLGYPSLLMGDYLTLLVEQGDEERALSYLYKVNITPAQKEALPAYALEALAKSARDNQRFDIAADLYQIGSNSYPQNQEFELGLVLTHIDQGKRAVASQLLTDLSKKESFINGSGVLQEVMAYYSLHFDNVDQAAIGYHQVLLNNLPTQEGLNNFTYALSRSSYAENANDEELLWDSLQDRHPDSSVLMNSRIRHMLSKDDHTFDRAALDDLMSSVNHTQVDSTNAYRISQIQRDYRRFFWAEYWARLAWRRAPGAPEHPILIALIYADQSRTDEALNLLSQIDQQELSAKLKKDYFNALAYSYQRDENYIAAIKYLQQIVEQWPEDSVAYRQWILSIALSGAPEMALEKAIARPQGLSLSDWRLIYSHRAAIAIRWSQLPFDDMKEKYRRIELAKQISDEYISYLHEHFPENSQFLAHARFDRLLIYRDRGDHDQVVAEYIELKRQYEIPSYIKSAVASSYLYLKEPVLAKDVLIAKPGREELDFHSQLLLGSTELDLEDYDAAKDIIDEAANKQPVWRSRDGMRYRRENVNRLIGDRNRFLTTAFGNNLEEAEKRYVTKLAIAPHNTDFRTDLGNIYRWRGWPEKALAEYEMVAAVEPRMVDAQVAASHTYLALRQYKEAEKSIDYLSDEYYRLPSVIQLNRDRQIHNSPQLISHFSRGLSDGSNRPSASSTANNADLRWDSFLYSAPLAYQYRVFVHGLHQFGEFSEGGDRYQRVGLGFDYRALHWAHRAEASQSTLGVDQGILWQSEYRWNDYWSNSLQLDSFSTQVALRARAQGIEGRSLDLTGLYRENEINHYRFGLGVLDYSDGNTASSIVGSHYRRFFQSFHHSWALISSLSVAKNSQLGGPYYSPEQSVGVNFALEYEGIIRRRYTESWKQRLLVELGIFNENEQGSGASSKIEYEHRWRWLSRVNAHLGLGIISHPYDGEDEIRKYLFAGVDWRIK